MKNSLIMVMAAICSLTVFFDPVCVGDYTEFCISPLLLGAAIVGAGNVAGTIIGGSYNNKATAEANATSRYNTNATNAYNYAMFHEQLDYNSQMYEDQKQYNQQLIQMMNDYNNPVNQRQRFEQAGINPYFALGNIDSGNMQSAMGVNPPSAPSAAPKSKGEIQNSI